MSSAEDARKLSSLISGYWISQAVYVAAKLGIADLLKEQRRTAADLAEAVSADPQALYRLLRTLASYGVFAEEEDHRFSLTPMAEMLQSDSPVSLRDFALMMGEEQFHCGGDMIYSVETGQPAFDRIYDKPIFEYLAQNPEKAQIFDRAMVGVHGRETPAILDAYDFSRFTKVADIGGGNGSLLKAILSASPALQGILYDLPHVVERANGEMEAAGLTDRVHLVAGDFFESVPCGADAYILRHIIHDWDHDRCVRILQNVRRAMPQTGRLLLVECVIPPDNEPHFGKLLDLVMLVVPGGCERTADEYRLLLDEAGFELRRIVPTSADVSILEAVKV